MKPGRSFRAADADAARDVVDMLEQVTHKGGRQHLLVYLVSVLAQKQGRHVKQLRRL